MGSIEDKIKDQFEGSSTYEGIDADKIWAGVSDGIDASSGFLGKKWGAIVLISGLVVTSFLLGKYGFNDTHESASIELESISPKTEQFVGNDKLKNNKKETLDLHSNKSSLNNNKNSSIQTEDIYKTIVEEGVMTTTNKIVSNTKDEGINEMALAKDVAISNSNDKPKVRDGNSNVPISMKNNKSEVQGKETSLVSTSDQGKESLSSTRNGIHQRTQEVALSGRTSSNNKIESDSKIDLITAKVEEGNTASNLMEMNNASNSLSNRGLDFIPIMGLPEKINKTHKRLATRSMDKLETNYVKKFNLPLELSIYAGWNTRYSSYQKSDNDLDSGLKNSLGNKIGYTFGGRLTYVTKFGWRVGSGLNIDHVNSSFNYNSEKETTIVLENQLIDFDITASGDTLNPVYGDVTVNGIEIRNVRHFNQSKLFSIPLEFGFEKDLGSVDFGLNFGLSYNLYKSQQGKTFDSTSEITEYNSRTSGALPFNNSFIGYHINPYLDLGLGDKIDVRSSLIMNYQPNGISTLYDLRQSALQMGLNLGLVYKF